MSRHPVRPHAPHRTVGLFDRMLARLLSIFQRIHPDTAARSGAALGLLCARVCVRRQLVSRNLARALGLRGSRRGMVARRAYATMGANFLEIGCDPCALQAKTRCLNPDWLAHLARLHEGRLVLVTMHLGQWDLGPVPVAGHDPAGRVAVLAKPLRSEAVTAFINTQRERLGMEVVTVDSRNRRSFVRILDRIRGGRPVGTVADQGPRPSRGWPVRFLGVPTYAHPGPVQLAMKGGAALVPVTCLRRSAGETVIAIHRPIPWQGRRPEEVLQTLMDHMSAQITRHPGQYFWHHRRFKYRWNDDSGA